MRYEDYALQVVTDAGQSGGVLSVKDLAQKWIQFAGTFVATLLVQGTINGTDFVTIATVTSAGLVEVPQTLKAIRIFTSAYTSGTPGAVISGFLVTG